MPHFEQSKIAIAFLALSFLTTPHLLAQAQTQTQTSPRPPAFEVASVRQSSPNHGYTSISPFGTSRFTAANASLSYLIQIAYEVDGNKIDGKPDWLDSEYFDISAKASDDTHLTYEQVKPLLQQLLEQRFHLAVHRETKVMPGYVLLLAKDGPRLQPTKGSAPYQYIYQGKIRLQNGPLEALAAALTIPIGRPVVDKTGIETKYDIKLDYSFEGATDSNLPSIFTAVQEQLGLKLEPQKVPIQMLIIDHIDKVPTEN